MRVTILLLFLASLSPAAFGQGAYRPAPPTDSYTDKDSGFVFPPMVGPFQRTGVAHVKDPRALWVDYRGYTPEAKVSIRVIARRQPYGPKGAPACEKDRNAERDHQQKILKSFVSFSEPKPPEFPGYASTGLTENTVPAPGHVWVYDGYFYCSRTTPWMVLYGFMGGRSADAKAQEIAFIRSVKPPGE